MSHILKLGSGKNPERITQLLEFCSHQSKSPNQQNSIKIQTLSPFQKNPHQRTAWLNYIGKEDRYKKQWRIAGDKVQWLRCLCAQNKLWRRIQGKPGNFQEAGFHINKRLAEKWKFQDQKHLKASTFTQNRARIEVQKFAKEGKTEERVLADDWLF